MKNFSEFVNEARSTGDWDDNISHAARSARRYSNYRSQTYSSPDARVISKEEGRELVKLGADEKKERIVGRTSITLLPDLINVSVSDKGFTASYLEMKPKIKSVTICREVDMKSLIKKIKDHRKNNLRL